MAVLSTYKGLEVVEGATGAGGAALTDDFKELADRAPTKSAADPGAADDADAGYFAGSLWFNSATETMWVCTDATAGSAVWKSLYTRSDAALTLIPQEAAEAVVVSGELGVGTTDPGAKLGIHGTDAGTKGLLVRGAAGQTANLQEWQNSSGHPIARIMPDGNVHVGATVSASLTTQEVIVSSAQDSAAGNSIIVAGNSVLNRGVFKGVRSRGTLMNPSVPLPDDCVLSFLGAIYDGDMTHGTATVDFFVDGPVSVGAAPQRISFSTSTTTGSNRAERLTIKSTGQVRLVPMAADPPGAQNGDLYYNSTTHKFRGRANGVWVNLH